MRPMERHATRAGKWKRNTVLVLSIAGVVGICLLIRSQWGPDEALAQGPRRANRPPASNNASSQPTAASRAAATNSQPATSPPAANGARGATSQPQAQVPAGRATAGAKNLNIVARVNHETITRKQLGDECVLHFGEEVLDSVINKHLIAQYCQNHGVTITRQEVEDEITRVAQRFGIPRDQWLQMLETERNITTQQYASDVIWPTLALRKLAASQLNVSDEERQKAYETQFGPQVKARMIAFNDQAKAEEVRQMAMTNPDDFPNLARQHSIDVNTRSLNGLIQPIRRHLGAPEIEEAAFQLQQGEISAVIPVGEQFVLLKCEGVVPARNVDMVAVQRQLDDSIMEGKLRTAGGKIFEKLRDEAKVQRIYDDPQLKQQQPGVAALINGRPLSMLQLAEECITRHGQETLDSLITRRMIEQACAARKIQITNESIDGEIARAATWAGKTDAQGRPDVQGWLQSVTEEQGISIDIYIRDAVWPTVALKQLVADRVEVTDEDMQKGFESNYGPRVICRAIVLNSQRRAQEVWEMARNQPESEFFAELAEQYSVEAATRATGGEVPPIQRHGGRPILEKEAYRLKPGEISGIIQMADKFVILFCEGHTNPSQIRISDVRDLLYDEISEKKIRMAMAKEMQRLQETAQLDNYLTGETQAPQRKAMGPQPAGAAAAGQEPRQQVNPPAARRPEPLAPRQR
jgi:parvulin-like peptidyl-prolyl isomerase